jgi:hypothetical protein
MYMAIVHFPQRCRFNAIWIVSVEAWTVIAGSHGWVFGSLDEARAEARWLSRNLGLPVREAAA